MILTSLPPRNDRPANPFDDGLVERDRRRPGRRAASPTLLSLLRGTTDSAGADPGEATPDSGLINGSSNFGRCILFTLLLALPFWGGIGAVCYWLTRWVPEVPSRLGFTATAFVLTLRTPVEDFLTIGRP